MTLPSAGAFRLLLALGLLLVTWGATSELPGPVLVAFNDKLLHLAAFLALALLTDFAFRGSAFGSAKFLPLLGYGLALETVQHFLPFRDFSVLDLVADGLGLVLYRGLVPWLQRLPPLAARWERAGSPLPAPNQGADAQSVSG